MPCTDPRDVTCIGEAFDLTTIDVLQWELELIWRALELDLIHMPRHARRAAEDDSVPFPAVWRIIRDGSPRSKDISDVDDRQIGINFEGKRRGGGWIRVKVAWLNEYYIATVHAV